MTNWGSKSLLMDGRLRVAVTHWCALAEHPLAPRLCMQTLMNGVPHSHTQCQFLNAGFPLHLSVQCSPCYWCQANRAKPPVWDPGLPWGSLLCKTACGLGLFRDEPVLCYFFVNLCISLNFGLLFGFQHLYNTVLLSGDTLPSALHCLCQSPRGISFPSRKIGMEQKLNLLKLCHAPMEIYAQIHMRSYTAAQLLPAPSLNTVSTTVKFHDV